MELPTPRLINLIWSYYIKDYDADGKKKLREELILVGRRQVNPLTEITVKKAPPVRRAAKPVEGEKATLGSRNIDYVPPWWNENEGQAYQQAKIAMKGVSSLPKMKP